MKLRIEASSLVHDVDVTVVDPHLTVGDLYEEVSGQRATASLIIDGTEYQSNYAIGSLPLRDGSVVSDRKGHDTTHCVTELRRIAGDGSGRSVHYPPGTWAVEGDKNPQFWLAIQHDGTATVYPDDHTEVWVDGMLAETEDIEVKQYIQTPDAVFRVGPSTSQRPRDLAVDNKIPIQRRPQKHLPEPATLPKPPRLPNKPKPAEPLSWFVVAAPIPIAIIALKLSPFFLLFILMTPLLAIARWLEAKRKNRSDRARYERDSGRLTQEYSNDLQSWAHTESERLRTSTPDFAEAVDSVATAGTGLWARRSASTDFLRVAVGVGETRVPATTTGVKPIDAITEASTRIQTTPITVELNDEPAIGIVGDPYRRTALARSIVTQLTAAQGPSDLTLAVLATSHTAPDWEWSKWLPHLETEVGGRNVAIDVESGQRLLNRLPRPNLKQSDGTTALPATVAIVDGVDYLRGDFTALPFAVREQATHAIVLAERFEDLPAICSAVVDVGHAPTVTSMTSDYTSSRFVPIFADEHVAEKTAQTLAGYLDPDGQQQSSTLPRTCSLRSLLDGKPTTETLLNNWTTPSPGLHAALGVTRHGPLTIDLVNDGPHALIAGMTGSGKSELLRTLVASLAWNSGPQDLNLVLIDFKGGGAFDACAELPHTVGVVTDLDEQLAERALRCLKAEIRHREKTLRSLGANDLKEFPAGESPLPRLVVLVDEFATLAAELPTFMNSLVDVAQRGRSLGVHLLLATQRPSGVIDSKIRSNTNLRICLRVQDDRDSLDVIDDRRAADIDRRVPGRGYVRLDASELSYFQTAMVSERNRPTSHLPLEVKSLDLLASQPSQADDHVSGQGPDQPPSTDLEMLVRSCRVVADRADYPPPRVPWPPPLPEHVDPAVLWDNQPATTWHAPLGIIDLPDQQRVERFVWSPEASNLAIYGTDAKETAEALRTLTISLALGNEPDEVNVYLIDFSGGGTLADLQQLPHVGAVIHPQESERLHRLIAKLTAELERRSVTARNADNASAVSDQPLTMLLIANYGALTNELEDNAKYELANKIERLTRDGPLLGLYVAVTANHERGIPTRIAGQVTTRLVMNMADPNSYLSLGLASLTTTTNLPKGRAIGPDNQSEIQLVTYQRGIVERLASVPTGSATAAEVRTLGTEIDRSAVAERSTRSNGYWNLVVGLRYEELDAAVLELHAGTNVIVSGRSGAGKTETLRGVAQAVLAADPSSQLITVTANPEEWPQAVDSFSTDLVDPSRPCFVLVDDIRTVSSRSAQELESIVQEPNVWVVATARPQALTSPPPWVRKLAASQTGIFLQPSSGHGDIVRHRLPPAKNLPSASGRGFVVANDTADYVQLFQSDLSETFTTFPTAQIPVTRRSDKR